MSKTYRTLCFLKDGDVAKITLSNGLSYTGTVLKTVIKEYAEDTFSLIKIEGVKHLIKVTDAQVVSIEKDENG